MAETAEMQLPPSLKTWLDEGCDLTVIPDLENYAKVIVIARHKVPEAERERLAAHFWRNLTVWLDGDAVRSVLDGQMVEPSVDRIRHAMWMVQGLTDMEVAERFEAALPETLRALVWKQMSETGDWPL